MNETHAGPPLGELSAQDFLRDYWQQRPLLIPQAFADFQAPISPEELAGLACEEGVAARLVLEHGATPWEVRHGPFTEADFAQLPATNWTLLVTDVEKHLPELHTIIEAFRFIPDWRIDDLMVSFAPEQGSVGPHTDEYDVFLLQAQGRRRWSISEQPFDEDDLVEGIELGILKAFEAEQSWVLEPGDMLYLPPRVAHHGVALEDGMTFSIGFRAPEYRDMLADLIESLIASPASAGRYADPGLILQANPGEISRAAIEQVRTRMRRLFDEVLKGVDIGLGCYVTEPKADAYEFYFETASLTGAEFLKRFEQCGTLRRNPAARFAYIYKDDAPIFFSDGEALSLSAEVGPAIEALCDQFTYHYAEWREHCKRHDQVLQTLTGLFNHGLIGCIDE